MKRARKPEKERYPCRGFLCLLMLWALLLPTLALPAEAAGTQTEGETIRVGYMLHEHFQEGSEGEVKSGYGYEYLQMLRNYTGWNYTYVYGSWEELLGMLKRGEIDLLSHVARTPEREESLLFSVEPQGRDTHYLFVCGRNNTIQSNDLTTLNGKTIGAIRGDFRKDLFADWCEERGITCNIVEYWDADQMHEDLHNDVLDGVTESRLAISVYPGDWKSVLRFDDAAVYFAVNKDRPDLMEEINEAQREILLIHESYGEDLMQKYDTSYRDGSPELTAEEKQTLQRYPVLRVGYCEDRRPLAYTDSTGQLSGLLSDYLRRMTETYGLRFETVPYENGIAMLDALQSGQVDIISPVGYNYGMAERGGVSITDPITVAAMVAVYKGYKGTEPKDIFQRVAVLHDSITEKDYLKRHYPDAEMVEAESVGDAINMVQDGRADCYMMRATTWSWNRGEYPTLKKLEVLNLPNDNDVNMAVRTEDVALIPLLNKGISLMSEGDINQAIVGYADARDETSLFTAMRENPLTTGLVFGLVLLVFVLIFVGYRLHMESRYTEKLMASKEEAERARIDAERANRAKSTFLTSMSHDIRTPMNAVIGMTTLASKHLDSPEYVQNCLKKITLASDHLLTLINDVLDINKIETGKLSLNPTMFSLPESIMNLANIGRHQIHEKGHQFEIRVHKVKEEYLFADELRINQIFINLLSNAVKYTPAGGQITVDIKQGPTPGDPGKVRLTYVIQDTGIGMSEEFQEHMYELFSMANKHDRSVVGSGVGLAICKQLVDLMGGSIHCESALGKGTRFTVVLDLPVAEKVADHLMLPPMKLLLVDDDEIFLATASETLREIGLSPDCVDSGEKAVRMVTGMHAEGKDYPVIIIDWKMPGMSGIETTRAIRAQVGNEVSIIVISAYDPEDIREAALEAGANGFISKPFFRTQVYQNMREILGLHPADRSSNRVPQVKARGMHLLIAEDNDMNWEIARDLLGMYGITADRAENGQRCLDMLRHGPTVYDLVLMDIQMPVMDGYETTRAIRASQQEKIRRIPIVAMTADAYTEDILRCAEAGMDAHVAKPIDMEKLLTVIGDLRDKNAP